MPSDISSRDLRAVSAINYQMYAEELLEKIRVITTQLGEKAKQNKALDEVDQLVAIMVTAGDPVANDLLTIALSKLRGAVNPIYPLNYQTEEKIDMCSNFVVDAFKYAVSKHWQGKETLSDQIKANAFKSQAFVGEPQVLHKKLKRRSLKQIDYSED
jgi:hypothetical protein